MTSWRTYLSALAVLGLTVAACSDDGGPGDKCAGNLANCPRPRMDFEPSTNPIEISDSAIEVGASDETVIRVVNVGFATLKLTDVSLEYTAPDGASEAAPAFTISKLDRDLPASIEPKGGTTLPQQFNVTVKYTRQTDALPRHATLVLKSDDPFIEDGTLRVDIQTVAGAPALTTSPLSLLSFPIVPQGKTEERPLGMANTGSRTLHVGGFKIVQDGRFGVKSDEYDFDISGAEGIDGISLEEAIEIPPGESREVMVTFFSDSIVPAEGQLVIFSDDPVSGTTGHVVNLEANKDGACLAVRPTRIEFGGKKVGVDTVLSVDIESCGTQDLKVENLAFLTGSSPDFSLDFTSLGAGFEDGPTASNPIVIAPNDKVTLDVHFVPDSVNPRDADNVPIPDEGTIDITSNAYLTNVQVPVRGAGAAAECPVPVILVEEGEEVIPQTVVHLDGRSSYAPFGEITDYDWSIIESPADPEPDLLPNDINAQPSAELNVVGVYKIQLHVRDELENQSGTEECPDAVATILVQPDQAIHVELTWVTPGDSDESDTGDGAGTDLDLHFAHLGFARGPDIDADGAPDPWFDYNFESGLGWDVFWFNPHADWGTLGDAAQDNPGLDRDDTDGAGPENLNLRVPEDGVTYGIGVHYWNDWGYGPVDATVRVYHYADLVYEATQTNFRELEMWCVGRIHWPTVGVERCAAAGDPELVAPNYLNPFFRPPLFR